MGFASSCSSVEEPIRMCSTMLRLLDERQLLAFTARRVLALRRRAPPASASEAAANPKRQTFPNSASSAFPFGMPQPLTASNPAVAS